jgi:hypothetical protein
MAVIIILGIPSELFTHDDGNPSPAAFEKNMGVIIHKNPGVDSAFSMRYIMI